MKLKKAKIRITSLDSIKGEWQKALKGKATHTHKDDEIIFIDIDSVAKIFSKSRIELLMAIIKSSPHSIYELAKITERDFKNVHNDVKLLCDIGLIELKESGDARHGLTPVPLFSGIELDWTA